MPHLTAKEQDLVDKLARGRSGATGVEACKAVNKYRRRKGIEGVSVSAVHRYIKVARRGIKVLLGENVVSCWQAAMGGHQESVDLPT